MFGNGNLGVNFFFVLSGFLITYLLIAEKKLNGKINIKKFWIRRLLRIWPLFYFCVFFGFLIFPILKTAFGQIPNETASIGYYLTFTNNFDFISKGLPDASILGVLWSVAVEEQFYLVWPIFLFFLPIKRYWIAFIAVIFFSLLFRLVNPSPILYEHHSLSCIGDMAVGAFGAWLMTESSKFKLKIENLSKLKIILLYITFTICFLFRRELFSGNIPFINVVERIFIATIILFIILEQNFSKNSFFKMSSFKTISKLGKISYGLYCLHFVGILITTTMTQKLKINTELWQVMILETAVALFITILISSISYNFFEKPFLKIKEKFAFITR